MNESKATALLLTHYRTLRPKAVARKIAQRFASHDPDVEITDDGPTWFVECKMTDNALSAGQTRRLAELDAASRGRTLVCWIDRETRTVRFARKGFESPVAPSLRAGAEMLAALIQLRSEGLQIGLDSLDPTV